MVNQNSENKLREPTQDRSQQRVEAILQAARNIIAKKGCAGLTISGIAAEGEITAGSIYQYFPGKQAIIHKLCERFLSQIESKFAESFVAPPETREDVRELSLVGFDTYSDLHCKDPVVRDVLMGGSIDKEMLDLDWQNTLENQGFMASVALPFYPEEMHEEVSRSILIMLEFAVAATKIAISVPLEEQPAILSRGREMIGELWINMEKKADEIEGRN